MQDLPEAKLGCKSLHTFLTRYTKRNKGAADTVALFCFARKMLGEFVLPVVLTVVLKCGRNTSLLRNWSCVWF